MSKNISDITEIGLATELEDIFDNINTSTTRHTKIHYFDPNIKRTKLVLSGGGIKMIALIGAVAALNDLGLLHHINTFAGTSSGAILCFLLSIGYTSDELFEIIKLFDFNKLKNIEFYKFLTHYGLDDGIRLELFAKSLLNGKKIDENINFKKLYKMTGKTLIITATCINNKKIYYFSHKTAPNMKVITALRMSISIPIFYTPVFYKGKYYVDGGCIDNFPIHLFENNLDDVIGIYLNNIKDNVSSITNVEEYLFHTMQCLLEGHRAGSIKGFEKYCIQINLRNISAVDFHIDATTKKLLFDRGYDSVLSAFKSNQSINQSMNES